MTAMEWNPAFLDNDVRHWQSIQGYPIPSSQSSSLEPMQYPHSLNEASDGFGRQSPDLSMEQSQLSQSWGVCSSFMMQSDPESCFMETSALPPEDLLLNDSIDNPFDKEKSLFKNGLESALVRLSPSDLSFSKIAYAVPSSPTRSSIGDALGIASAGCGLGTVTGEMNGRKRSADMMDSWLLNSSTALVESGPGFLSFDTAQPCIEGPLPVQIPTAHSRKRGSCCTVCGATETPSWRRSKDEFRHLLCNACGGCFAVLNIGVGDELSSINLFSKTNHDSPNKDSRTVQAGVSLKRISQMRLKNCALIPRYRQHSLQ